MKGFERRLVACKRTNEFGTRLRIRKIDDGDRGYVGDALLGFRGYDLRRPIGKCLKHLELHAEGVFDRADEQAGRLKQLLHQLLRPETEIFYLRINPFWGHLRRTRADDLELDVLAPHRDGRS